MANKKRMKRKAAQSVQHLATAVGCILELKSIFEKDHPEYAHLFQVILDGIGIMIQELVGVYARAWGYFPDDLSKWLH